MKKLRTQQILQNEKVEMGNNIYANYNCEWFDEYREYLIKNDWFAYLDYVERHEHNRYLVVFPKLKCCVTKIPEFIINYN